jgi:glutamate dehydrogenase/leucine dehydrogenase
MPRADASGPSSGPADVRYARSPSSLANVAAEFDAAASHLKLPPQAVVHLKEPRLSLRLKLPVRMDDGSFRVFRAYHTVHSTARGPSIGGVQFRPHVDQDLVEALAFWSTHQCALLGMPFGGSWGAVECEPAELSAGELERLTRQYLAELIGIVKPNNDIITADIGANQQIMCWLMDTYSAHYRDFEPAVVLGKPADLGGLTAPVPAAALGVELCIRKACERFGLPLTQARVAIQGFGKAGKELARLLHAAGARVVAIADVSGAYVNERGIAIDRAVWHQESYGLLDGLEAELDVTKLDDPMGLFELPVDILVPAAVELQVTDDNVDRVQARIVAEVAYDPVSPGADRRLYERGTLVIPDILCNAGGVSGYYLEWVQNRMGYYWPAEQVRRDVCDLVGQAFDAAMQVAEADAIPLRLAAAVVAVKRLAAAVRLRGAYG